MINYGMTGVETDYDGQGLSNWIIDQFQDGILYYNYRGIYGDTGTSPSNQYNNGYQTPFATVMTCGTGDFDEGNSQTESFVKLGSVSNPEGAVGAIGLSTTGTHTAYNNIVNMGIYHGIFASKVWYAGAAAAAEDKDDFTIMLVSAGDKKINVIKEVRAATSLGLKEAKDLVEGAPKEVKSGVNKKEAEEIKAKLEAAGAKVELK